MQSPDQPADQQTVRRAAWAGLIGTALEQYDFVIYGTAAALVFNDIFFPDVSPAVGFIASFSTYAVGFAARPLGGLFFSHFGDRVGRKWVLVATLLLMGVSTFFIGLLPTYDQVGLLAPILLVVLRILQGFGAGAEQAGGIVLLTETAAKGRRGRYASLVFVGAAAGTALGAVIWILVQLWPEDDVMTWGWRLVFFSSVVVTVAAFIIRRKMSESPVFKELKTEGVVERQKAPISDVLKHGRFGVARVFFMNLGTNAHSYVFQVFMGSYLISQLEIDKAFIPKVLLIGALFACVSAYVFGTLSDRFGRRPMYLIVTGFLLIFPVPAFMLLGTQNLVLIGLVIVLGLRLRRVRHGGCAVRVLPGALRFALSLRRRRTRPRVLGGVRRRHRAADLFCVGDMGIRIMVAGSDLHDGDHGDQPRCHHRLAGNRRPRPAHRRGCRCTSAR